MGSVLHVPLFGKAVAPVHIRSGLQTGNLRDITDTWPEDGITMDVNKMLKARGIDPDESHA